MKKNLTSHSIAFIIIALLSGSTACNLSNNKETQNNTANADNNANTPELPNIPFSVVKTFPHDTSSFTQGLFIHNGKMYEGTGLEGRSKLMQVDINTGKASKSHNLADEFFGEGIAVLNEVIYQLTWRNKVVFSYNINDFKPLQKFSIATEGWGITTDGQQLIVSDGTSNLYFYEPETFALTKQITVKDRGMLSPYLNELEYIDGYIYANKFMTPFILKIDPQSGEVVGRMDLSSLWHQARTKHPRADVPNGIAYDAETKKIYVTGKLWPELYEIKIEG